MDEFEIVFPCEYAIKVIGEDVNGFEKFVRGVIVQHIPDLLPESFSTRNSSKNNYLSITVSFCAESRDQLNSLYSSLGADSRVKLIL